MPHQLQLELGFVWSDERWSAHMSILWAASRCERYQAVELSYYLECRLPQLPIFVKSLEKSAYKWWNSILEGFLRLFKLLNQVFQRICVEPLVACLVARQYKILGLFLAINIVDWDLDFIAVLRMCKLNLAHDFTLRWWVYVQRHELLFDSNKVLIDLLLDFVDFQVGLVKFSIQAYPRLRDIVITARSFLPDDKGFELVDCILKVWH